MTHRITSWGKLVNWFSLLAGQLNKSLNICFFVSLFKNEILCFTSRFTYSVAQDTFFLHDTIYWKQRLMPPGFRFAQSLHLFRGCDTFTSRPYLWQFYRIIERLIGLRVNRFKCCTWISLFTVAILSLVVNSVDKPNIRFYSQPTQHRSFMRN